jgi:hypothetical protein
VFCYSSILSFFFLFLSSHCLGATVLLQWPWSGDVPSQSLPAPLPRHARESACGRFGRQCNLRTEWRGVGRLNAEATVANRCTWCFSSSFFSFLSLCFSVFLFILVLIYFILLRLASYRMWRRFLLSHAHV